MKNSKLLLIASLATTLGLSACNVKNPSDVTNDLQKRLDETMKQTGDLIGKLNSHMEQGGQPGTIKVSGVIIKDDSQTDARITVLFKGGTGKDGSDVKLSDTVKPTLSSKNEKLDLSNVTGQKTLVSLGCKENVAAQYAQERSLEIQKISPPALDYILTVSAKTIVLCGDMDKLSLASLTGQFITFVADELILDHVDYTLSDIVGLLSFNANRLLLQGSSRIGTAGIASSMTMSSTAALELNVLKEISSSTDGKLLLMSSGSNYKVERK